MAFMIPVVKKDWDVYNTKSNRRSSALRSRGSSENSSKGPSLSSSPETDFMAAAASPHREPKCCSPPRVVHFGSDKSSRTSSGVISPSKSRATASPNKAGSSHSLNKFHTKLVDKLKKSLKICDGEDTRES